LFNINRYVYASNPKYIELNFNKCHFSVICVHKIILIFLSLFCLNIPLKSCLSQYCLYGWTHTIKYQTMYSMKINRYTPCRYLYVLFLWHFCRFIRYIFPILTHRIIQTYLRLSLQKSVFYCIELVLWEFLNSGFKVAKLPLACTC
jgi:hypothetical protein